MGDLDDLLYWIHRTKDVAHMGYAKQFGAI